MAGGKEGGWWNGLLKFAFILAILSVITIPFGPSA